MLKRLKARIGILWHSLLGRDMTWRLGRLLIPNLVWNQEIYGRLLLASVSRETRWMDAGCGHQVLPSGLETIEDAAVAKPRLAVGVDLDFDSLRRHRSFHLTVCSSVDFLPFASGTFDLVTCNMVAEHLPNPEVTLRELGRVLIPGGLLVVHTPNLLSYVVVMARIARALLPRRVYLALVRLSEARDASDVFPAFYRANTRGRLRRTLEASGFRQTTCRMLVAPRPVCNFFAPIGLLELMFMRATMLRPFSSLASAILATYEKVTAAHPLQAARAVSCATVVGGRATNPPIVMQEPKD